jgi:hypothetical protein
VEIEEDRMRLEGEHDLKSLGAGAGAADVITNLGEKELEQVGDLRVIVHDEDTGGGSRRGHNC